MANYLPPKPYHLQPGTVLDRFELLGAIGQGGFALTYLAQDTQLEREVIIKEYFPSNLAQRNADGYTVIPTSDEAYQEGLVSFYQEAQALSQLQHPNIADVISVIRDNDTAYIVMPYYAGKDLEVYLEELGEPLSEVAAFEITKPILRALDYIHSEKIIHRDIKPANILMAERGSHVFPVLIDFGGARQFVADVTQNYTQLLSFGYAPFEQYFKDGKQGPWTDIYACAAVLYRMVSGTKPPDATERKAGKALNLVLFSQAVIPVMQKALSENYKDRYQSAKEFSEAFDGALKATQAQLGQGANQVRMPAANLNAAGTPQANLANQGGEATATEEPAKEKTEKRGFLGCLIPVAILAVLAAVGAGVWWQFFRTRVYTADTPAKLERYLMDAKKGSIIEIPTAIILSRSLDINQELTLKGTSPETSRLESPGNFPVIRFNSAESLTLSNLTLSHTGQIGSNVLEVEQGKLSLDAVVIQGAVLDPATGQGGRGVLLKNNAQLNAISTQFQNNELVGLEASGANTLSLSKSYFQCANMQAKQGCNGQGLVLKGSSQTTLTDSQILRSIRSGIETQENAQLSLGQSILQENGTHGVNLKGGSQLTSSNSLFHNNLSGILAEGNAVVTIKDSTFSQNEETGLWLVESSRGSAENSRFENNYIGIAQDASQQLSESNNQFSGNQEDRSP